MKELETNEAAPVGGIEKQVKKQVKHLGRIKKLPGLQLFSLDLSTGKIEKVKLESKVVYDGDSRTKQLHKVEAKANLMYVQALNLKNARSKFLKEIKSK